MNEQNEKKVEQNKDKDKNPVSILIDRLNFNPSSGRPDKEVFESALKIVREKRIAELQGRAVELLEKAMDICKKHDKLCKDFKKEEEKTMKELKKLVKSIETMANGGTVEEEEENKN